MEAKFNLRDMFFTYEDIDGLKVTLKTIRDDNGKAVGVSALDTTGRTYILVYEQKKKT